MVSPHRYIAMLSLFHSPTVSGDSVVFDNSGQCGKDRSAVQLLIEDTTSKVHEGIMTRIDNNSTGPH